MWALSWSAEALPEHECEGSHRAASATAAQLFLGLLMKTNGVAKTVERVWAFA